jgi:hypothetical protein
MKDYSPAHLSLVLFDDDGNGLVVLELHDNDGDVWTAVRDE